MLKKLQTIRNEREGFTLVELLISIVIFMIFLGIVSQSYISIVRAQRQANEVRKMYSDVRLVMDFIAEEVRLSSIDYDCYAGKGSDCEDLLGGSLFAGRTDHLVLIRQGGTAKTFIKLDQEGHIVVKKLVKREGQFVEAPGYETSYRPLTSDRIVFEDLTFAIFPDVNPYSNDTLPGSGKPIYADNGTQFQPKVTVLMRVVNDEDVNTPFAFDFQTTISSRVYSRAT